MKRLLLLSLFFISVSVSMFAQFSTIDFETVGNNWDWNIFANGTGDSTDFSIAPNPDNTGINTSSNAAKFIVNPDATVFAGVYSDDLPDFTIPENFMPTVMVYKDVISDFALKLEGGTVNHEVKVPNTVINQWEELTFDFSADEGLTAGRITIIPDFPPDPRPGGSTNYFDNIDFGVVIPVELTSFTGSYVGQTVKLNWTTATELNNNGFDIQRSVESGNFVTVGFVQGKGTSTETTNYSFVDKNISSHTEYSYRLKQIDFDGNYSFSDIINLGASLPVSLVLDQNYPNPFNPVTNISFALPSKSNVSLEIYNQVGQKVMTLVQGSLEEGTYNYTVDASNLSSGIYIYSLSSSGDNGLSSVITRKMTLLK